jgi:NSS family neurotransmitter:Na+ symporter
MAAPLHILFWYTLFVLLTMGIVGRGVKQGLERAVTLLFPAMLVIMFIILGYSATTQHFGQAFQFLFHPNFQALKTSSGLAALGHAFFTLSLASGAIMMYGAYLPSKVSIPRASIAVLLADTLIALIAGLAIFPLVFANHLEPQAGPGLLFQTLPIAFGHMPYGTLLGALFFIMLLLAALTSAISFLEPSFAWLMERFHYSRRRATTLVGLTLWIIGLGSVFSFNIIADLKFLGFNFYNAVEQLTSNLMLPLNGLFIAIFTGWVIKTQWSQQELAFKYNLSFLIWKTTLRYISPVIIILLFLDVMNVF